MSNKILNSTDQENLDTLSIYVKNDKLDIIEKCYNEFGWLKVDSTENKLYEDTTDVVFSRPHTIKNKDDLQFLQVELENKLNEHARLEKSKHQTSTILAFLLGLIVASVLVSGIFLIVNHSQILFLYVGILLSIISLAAATIVALKVYCQTQKENVYFQEKSFAIYDEIENICKRAKNFWSDNYE